LQKNIRPASDAVGTILRPLGKEGGIPQSIIKSKVRQESNKNPVDVSNVMKGLPKLYNPLTGK